MKRLFDFLAVCFALPLIIPALSIIAFLIKQDSSDPIFFRQTRVGLRERSFKVCKFRTMVDSAEEKGSSVTTRKDPRITAFGRILRKTKLDELPQLLNVFRGDMSLVGPRPEVLEIVQNYSPEMRRIFAVSPGITSVASLHLRNEEDILARMEDADQFYEDVLVPLKVTLAMEHLDRNSFAFDLSILCQTVWMITFGRWWPIAEHLAVVELIGKIEKDNQQSMNRRKPRKESNS